MTQTVKTACRLFVSVALTGCVCGLNLSVWQTPRNITAESGERVTLTCHFTLRTSEGGRWRLEWRKNNSAVAPAAKYNISDINTNTVTEVNKSHTLTLHPVNVSHSGIYYCKVWQDVPRLGPETVGGGTELTVYDTVRTTTASSAAPSAAPSTASSITHTDQDVTSVIWNAVLALVLIIVCFTSVMWCVYRGYCRRTKLKREYQCDMTDETIVFYTAVIAPED